MSRDYRLWEHEPKAPKKSANVVIAKVAPRPETGTRSPLSASGRRAMAAGVRPESALARLLEDGQVANIRPVFDDPLARSVRAKALLGGTAIGTRGAKSYPSLRIVEIEVNKGSSPTQLAAHLARMNDVEYAFVPPVRKLMTPARKRVSTPDPLSSRLWGHGAIRLGHARAAKGFANATNIVVAVVDSGIDQSHPDLRGAIIEYKNFLGGSDKDFVGHGTHVSGIIAAIAGNGLGISGVCGSRILALKALPRDGEEYDAPAYYRALRYVIGRAKVLNLSLGGPRDPAEIDIINDIINAGVVVVAAMGNEFEDGNPTSYPAAIPGVCAVGATDELDRRAPFSNTGRHISLVAPGVGILSTTPTFRYDGDGEREYDAWDGTSMATPYVSGVAALILAKSPNSTPAQVIKKLTSSADKVGRAKKGSPSYGAGRLNCEKALT